MHFRFVLMVAWLAMVACRAPSITPWAEAASSGDRIYVGFPLAKRGNSARLYAGWRLDVPSNWQELPRTPSEKEGEWRLNESLAVTPFPGPPDRGRSLNWKQEALVLDGNAETFPRDAHRLRALGSELYQMRTQETPDGVEIELLASEGWPLQWTRPAHFTWDRDDLEERREAYR